MTWRRTISLASAVVLCASMGCGVGTDEHSGWSLEDRLGDAGTGVPSTPEDAGSDTAPMTSPDVGERDAGPHERSDAEVASDGGTAPAEDAHTDPSPAEFDPEAWQQPNPCSGQVSPNGPEEEFSLPLGRPRRSAPSAVTRGEFLSRHGSIRNEARARIFPDESMWPGNHVSTDLYKVPGTNMPLHLYVYNGYDLDIFRYSVTILVDYQPVPLHYVRWNDDRSAVLSDEEATGINHPFDSDFEIIDVTVPARLFDEARMYEVSVNIELHSVGEVGPRGYSQRFTVYNGGYASPGRPCAEPRLGEPMTPWEVRLMRETDSGSGMLFVDGIPSDYDWMDTLRAEPGETRTFYFTARRAHRTDGPKDMAAVPVLNGQPLQPPWWIREGGTDGVSVLTADARKSFEVTFPEEAGVYEVEVLTWPDPYEPYRTLDGEAIDGVVANDTFTRSSNALRFIVGEAGQH